MSNFEWFLLVVVVVAVPLLIAVIVTLWTLEMARQRNRANRPGAAATIGVKRSAIRADGEVGGTTSSLGAFVASTSASDVTSPSPHHHPGNDTPRDDGQSSDGTLEATPDASKASHVSDSGSGGSDSGGGSDLGSGSDAGSGSGGDSNT